MNTMTEYIRKDYAESSYPGKTGILLSMVFSRVNELNSYLEVYGKYITEDFAYNSLVQSFNDALDEYLALGQSFGAGSSIKHKELRS